GAVREPDEVAHVEVLHPVRLRGFAPRHVPVAVPFRRHDHLPATLATASPWPSARIPRRRRSVVSIDSFHFARFVIHAWSSEEILTVVWSAGRFMSAPSAFGSKCPFGTRRPSSLRSVRSIGSTTSVLLWMCSRVALEILMVIEALPLSWPVTLIPFP